MIRKNGELWHVDVQMATEVIFHEAVVRQSYYDSEKVLTWSAGLTNATGHRVERYIRNSQTMQQCMNIYVWALERYADQVRKVFRGVKLTKAQFTAALSFHWNTGGILRAIWVRQFIAGNIAQARKTFMNWGKPPAILERRAKERELFFEGTWSSNGTVTEYTKVNQRTLVPVWSSAKRVNVKKELTQALMIDNLIVPLDQDPQPDNVPLAPTLSPTEEFQRSLEKLELKTPGKLKLPDAPQISILALVTVSIGTVLATGWDWFVNLPCTYLNIFCGG